MGIEIPKFVAFATVAFVTGGIGICTTFYLGVILLLIGVSAIEMVESMPT